jgi:hypothetical protein
VYTVAAATINHGIVLTAPTMSLLALFFLLFFEALVTPVRPRPKIQHPAVHGPLQLPARAAQWLALISCSAAV